MTQKLRTALKYILSALVAVVLLYFSFRGVKWADFWQALRSCEWGYVLLAMAFGVLSFWIRGLRWKMLLLPIDPATRSVSCFNAVNISYLANMVLPRVGELVRCAYITKNSSEDGEGRKLASYDKVLGTMVADRLWDVVSLVVIAVAVMAMLWGRFGAFFSENVLDKAGFSVSWIIVAVVAACALFVAAAVLLRGRGGLWAKAYGLLRGMGQGLSTCLRMRRSWMFIVYTLLIWGCYWMMSVCIVWASQGIDPSAVSPDLASALSRLGGLDMADGLFLMIAGSLSSIVPVPGGFGAFHYLVSLALQTVYGIPFGLGIIFATLSHESQVVTQIICGGLSYVVETLRK